jgi:anti-anti-sigma factor
MIFKKTKLKNHVVISVKLKSATIEHTEEFKTLFEELIIDGTNNIIVDLLECDFIDSTFMGVLVRCHKEIQRKDGKLKIVCDGKVYFLLHDVTHLSSVIKIYKSRQEALNAD